MEVVRLLVGKGCKLDDKTDGVGSHLYFVRREKRPHDSGDRSPYSSVDHVREAGRRIVEDYARHKSVTKRRADRGGKAEELVRAALRAVLPEWIGVEHGFVVDSYGFTMPATRRRAVRAYAQPRISDGDRWCRFRQLPV